VDKERDKTYLSKLNLSTEVDKERERERTKDKEGERNKDLHSVHRDSQRHHTAYITCPRPEVKT
jgi:hypothetical protein